MHFLGLWSILIGFVPWAEVPAYLQQATPVAQAAGVAGRAAGAAALAAPALMLGAGWLGWEIGTQLRRAFFGEESFPQPTTPFQGGQSLGRYNVTIDGVLTTGGLYPLQYNNIKGPIVGITVSTDSTSFPQTRNRYGLVFDGGAQTVTAGDLIPDQIITAPYISSLVRIDAPDTTKNPVPQYPLAPFNPGVLNPTVPFPFLPGNPEYPAEIVPFQRPQIAPNTPGTEPGEEEEPKVTVNFPDLGLSFDFDKDGINPRGYNPQAYPMPQTQKDPRVTPPTRPPTTCECECDLQPVLDKLDEIEDLAKDIKECACEPEYVVQTVGLGGGQSLVATLPQRTICVTVELSTIPVNARMQSGDAAPTVYYAGWLAFSDGTGRGGERLPIHYGSTTFYPPEDATTVSYTLYEGFNGILSAKRRQVVEG